MADVDFDDFDSGYATHNTGPLTGRALTIVNGAGAVCSLALVIGLGIWGYKLAVRDVSGIPVVRALEGPLRVAPANPGGDVAMHQGLSVNAVAAAGTALPLPDKLILAPREITLTAEDQAGTAELSQLPDSVPLAGEASAPVSDTLQSSNLAPSLAPVEISPAAATEQAADIALDAEDPAIAAPLPATQEDAVAAALAMALADGDVGIESDTAAESVSTLRPKLRPATRTATPLPDVAPVVAEADADMTAVAAENVAPVAAPTNVAEIDPTTIAAGTRLVQLGAFDDEASARAEWAKLQGQFPDLLPGKAMVVQSAQSGGRTFYRLRAHGFADEAVARQFCATMLAANASCIPVAQK